MEFRIGPYDSYLENGDIYSSDDFLIRTQELIVNDFKVKIPVDCEELKLTYFEDPIFQMGPLRPRNKEYPIRSFDLKILSRLTNLKKLDMSFIKISVYSINFDNITLLTKLEELRLPNNDLRFLPLKILELTNLKKLSLIDSLFQRFNFDIDNLENFTTGGISLFMILPIEGEPHQVFNMMHNAARKIAEEFSAQIYDGRRTLLTKQSLQQYVEKIREFERQRMLKR